MISRLIDALERRAMLSVSTDGNGWTVVTPASDTQIVYVSSTDGLDTNDGLSATTTVQTIAAGVSRVRPGSADWLLLKRGDSWNESFGLWSLSGRTSQEPILIGAYGDSTARPIVNTGTSSGINTNGAEIDNLAIIGLNFHASGRDPASPDFISNPPATTGIRFVGGTTSLLIEDCAVSFYSDNVVIQDFNGLSINNVSVRRNVITDAWSTSKGQGLYGSGINNLLIEQNVLDHNGWNSSISGAVPTVYSHNLYLSARDTGVIVRGNIIANASSHGLQARSGGSITDNLFLKNPIGMSFGLVNGSNGTPGGVTGEVARNVFIDSRDINGSKRGFGIEIANIKAGAGANIHDNIFSQDSQNNSAALRLDVGTGVTNVSEITGTNDLTIEHNIVRKWFGSVWSSSFLVDGGNANSGLNRLTVRNNDWQLVNSSQEVTHGQAYSSASESWSGNRYYDDSYWYTWFSIGASTLSLDQWKSQVEPTLLAAQVNYLNPDRTAASYNASLGGSASLSAFLTEARKQSASNWRTQYTASAANDYVRGGFVETAPPTPVSPPPPPPPPPAPGNGLAGVYYSHIDFTGTTRSRTDPTINFNWATGSPISGIPKDSFSVRWTGFVQPATSQTYTITTRSDEGVRVWIGNTLLIDHFTAHSAAEDSATIALQAGSKYPIRIDYFDRVSKAVMQLYWATPTIAKQIVPTSALYPA